MHTTTSRLQSSGCEFAPPWGFQQYCRQVSPSLWAQDSELLQLWDYSFYKPSFNYWSFQLLLTFRLMQFLFHVHVLVCHKKTKHGFFFFQKLQRTFSQVVSGIKLQYHTWPVDRCGTISFGTSHGGVTFCISMNLIAAMKKFCIFIAIPQCLLDPVGFRKAMELLWRLLSLCYVMCYIARHELQEMVQI